MEETETIDYKKEYMSLLDEMKQMKEKHEYDLMCNEEKLRGTINTQYEEITFLKLIIKGILHI